MYKPETRNKKLCCDSLYILVSNNHCYKLNENLDRFNKLIWRSDNVISDEMTKIDINHVKDTYQIREIDEKDYNVIYIKSLKTYLMTSKKQEMMKKSLNDTLLKMEI